MLEGIYNKENIFAEFAMQNSSKKSEVSQGNESIKRYTTILIQGFNNFKKTIRQSNCRMGSKSPICKDESWY